MYYLSIYLPTHSPTHLHTCIHTYIHTHLPICLSICYLSIYLYLSISTYLPAHVPTYLSVSIYLSIYLPTHPPTYLSTYLSIHLSIHPSIYLIYLFIYLSFFYLFISQSQLDLCRPTQCFSRTWSNSVTHSVGLLWKRARPVAETYTWQRTTFTRDKHSCTRRDWNPQPQQARPPGLGIEKPLSTVSLRICEFSWRIGSGKVVRWLRASWRSYSRVFPPLKWFDAGEVKASAKCASCLLESCWKGWSKTWNRTRLLNWQPHC